MRNENIFLINLNKFQRIHYTQQGLYLNGRGKTKLAHIIIRAINWWSCSKKTEKHNMLENLFVKNLNILHSETNEPYFKSGLKDYHQKQNTFFRQNTSQIKTLHKKENNTTRNSKTLTIFHQNVDRISNKIERINALLDSMNSDIIIITEHGQRKEVLENTRLIGYYLVADFSRSSYIKGGVAIYAKESLRNQIEMISVHDLCIELVCEVAVMKIKQGSSVTFVIGVYRTKNNISQSLEVIAQTLEKIQPGMHNVILMGDINIDCLHKKNDYIQMQDILKSYNMERLDLPPTRVTPTSKTSIDCICTNFQGEEVHVEVIDAGISDHTGQLCTIKLNSVPPTVQCTMMRRHMNNRNLLELKSRLSQQDWNEVYSAHDVNDSYIRFLSMLTDAMNATCPLIKSKVTKKRTKSSLIDPTTFYLKESLIKALNQYNATGREDHKREALRIKKEYDLRLRLIRQQITKNDIAEAENKTKAIWKVINSERKSKKNANLPIELDLQGTLTSNPEKMADYLNNFFINVADDTIKKKGQLTGQLMMTEIDNSNIPTLILHPTNSLEVSQAINRLKPKTSSGYDSISAKLVKTCKEELTIPLVSVINKSFTTGVFPSALKLAKVFPLFKQGSPTQASNYRPISLIPTFSKIIERITLSRLISHVVSNKLLSTQQHGFLAGKSTITALITLVDFIIDQLEKGNTATSILLDYSKAFDCLSHKHLMAKLSILGVRGTTYNWFKSYLSGRSQYVELKHNIEGVTQNIKSESRIITRGVPQGSVLGPVLFILFTNDFPGYLHDYSESLMYADDTVLLIGNNNSEQLEMASYTALNMAVQYCHNNNLVVNESKSKQMIFGKLREVTGRLPDLEEVTMANYLGLTIDEDLSWTPHINLLCGKLSTSLFVIRRIKSICGTDTAKIAYHSLFESHLRYGIAVWGATKKGNLERILLLQKRAIRILGDLQPRQTCRESFRNLKILTVINLYIVEVVSFIHLKSPESLRTAALIHNYNTRHASNYCLPTHHHTMTEKKPSYAGARMWNILPLNLKMAEAHKFKYLLKEWLLVHPFYSLAEFFSWSST